MQYTYYTNQGDPVWDNPLFLTACSCFRAQFSLLFWKQLYFIGLFLKIVHWALYLQNEILLIMADVKIIILLFNKCQNNIAYWVTLEIFALAPQVFEYSTHSVLFHWGRAEPEVTTPPLPLPRGRGYCMKRVQLTSCSLMNQPYEKHLNLVTYHDPCYGPIGLMLCTATHSNVFDAINSWFSLYHL